MKMPEFFRLFKVIQALRDPDSGCPWDLKQTHQSLLKYLIEETYEFIDAVENNDDDQMEDELGDVLLQILLHSQMASEKQRFNLESVSKNLADKMIRRHPHVFEDQKIKLNSNQVIVNWERIKQTEKKQKKQKKASLIQHSLTNLPALYSSYKIGKKTHDIKFDWDNAHQVLYKVEEEWQELKEEIVPEKPLSQDRLTEELGDLLFSIAQLARHLKIDPEAACRQANIKFIRRFQEMEDLIKEDKKSIENMNQKQMDEYWAQVKTQEKLR